MYLCSVRSGCSSRDNYTVRKSVRQPSGTKGIGLFHLLGRNADAGDRQLQVVIVVDAFIDQAYEARVGKESLPFNIGDAAGISEACAVGKFFGQHQIRSFVFFPQPAGGNEYQPGKEKAIKYLLRNIFMIFCLVIQNGVQRVR